MGNATSSTLHYERGRYSNGACWEQNKFRGTRIDIPCDGVPERQRQRGGGDGDIEVTVGKDTFTINIEGPRKVRVVKHVDANGVHMDDRYLTDEEYSTYIFEQRPEGTDVSINSLYAVATINEQIFYVLKTVQELFPGGGKAKANKATKATKANKKAKTVPAKSRKAIWSLVGYTVNIPASRGRKASTRSLYENAKKPGDLRIRKMITGKDGVTVAKYVKPPSSKK